MVPFTLDIDWETLCSCEEGEFNRRQSDTVKTLYAYLDALSDCASKEDTCVPEVIESLVSSIRGCVEKVVA